MTVECSNIYYFSSIVNGKRNELLESLERASIERQLPSKWALVYVFEHLRAPFSVHALSQTLSPKTADFLLTPTLGIP